MFYTLIKTGTPWRSNRLYSGSVYSYFYEAVELMKLKCQNTVHFTSIFHLMSLKIINVSYNRFLKIV